MSTTGVFNRGGVWWIRYCGPRPDGSWGLIRESAGKDATEKQAIDLRENRVREAKNDRDGIRRFVGPRQRQATVGQLLAALEADYKTRRLRSLKQALVKIEHLRQFFGFKRATSVSRQAIASYIDRRRDEEAAEATIDRELELLRRAYTLAAQAERPVVAWVPRIPKLVKGHENAKQGFVERADFVRFLPELPTQILRDVAEWAYMTGMRKGEILSLTWDCYDRETKTLRLHARDSKTGKGRVIPVSSWPELAAVIERRLAVRVVGSPLIFHNGRGERVGGKTGEFWTTWERAIARAKVRYFSFHDLRRTAVRNMVRAGIDRTVAKRISGHETDAIFERYNIVDERDLADALEKRAAYEKSLAGRAR
jgi:integrase